MENLTILSINPGSTSTKIAVYRDTTLVLEKTLRHSGEELAPYEKISDQFEFRKEVIINTLRDEGLELGSLDAIVGRGGLLHPLKSGVYEVNDVMREDLRNSPMGEHASNLGGLIADDMAKTLGVRAFIVDPVVVDEMSDLARVGGHPLFPRKSIFHALNQKAIAHAYADQIGRPYEELNLIVAHLGGGISVGAHDHGRVVDVNNALDGEGPLTPERSGTLPAGELAKACFSGKYTLAEVKLMIKGEGGMMAFLGINDARDARARAVAGDAKAQLIVDAICYNTAKYICAMAAPLRGNVDAILITGGMAHSVEMSEAIRERVAFIAPVVVFPGEDEMLALTEGALRVLRGKLPASVYTGKR